MKKIRHALDLGRSGGVFKSGAGLGESTIRDIMGKLDAGQVVVVDTSGMGVEEERTVGNMLAGALLYGRRRAKSNGVLARLPPVGYHTGGGH